VGDQDGGELGQGGVTIGLDVPHFSQQILEPTMVGDDQVDYVAGHRVSNRSRRTIAPDEPGRNSVSKFLIRHWDFTSYPRHQTQASTASPRLPNFGL
jgi:hypothetical protein